MPWYVVALVLAAVVVAGGFVLYARVRQGFRHLFGGLSLKEVAEKGRYEDENVPRSVSSMTSLLLPRITADFPDFSWTEWRPRVQNAVRGALLAESEGNEALLSPFAGGDMREALRLALSSAKADGEKARFRDITVYRTEITAYTRTGDACVISTQTSVGLYAWREREGEVVVGSRDSRRQTKYNLDLVYVREAQSAAAEAAGGTVLHCPNCGAPVTDLGEKSCRYCGSAVIEIHDRLWRFGRLKEAAEERL